MFDIRRLPHRRVLIVATAAVILSACGGGGDSTGTPITAPPVDEPSDTVDDATRGVDDDLNGIEVSRATRILGTILDAGDVIGDDIDLTAVDGKPVVAWFWAPWCTICRAEGPTVADVAGTYTDQIVMVGVAGRGDTPDIQRFIDDTNTGSITHVADIDGIIWRDFGVFAQPAFAFITAEGDVDVFIGSLGEHGLIERIEALTET